MSRRSTPERLYIAHRTATINRLIGNGESPDRAEAKVSAWEQETSADNGARGGSYWDRAYVLILESIRRQVVRDSAVVENSANSFNVGGEAQVQELGRHFHLLAADFNLVAKTQRDVVRAALDPVDPTVDIEDRSTTLTEQSWG